MVQEIKTNEQKEKVKSSLDHINELQALAEMEKEQALSRLAHAEQMLQECEKARKSLDLPSLKRRDSIGLQVALRRQNMLDTKKYLE